jgi:hypothetical protein
MFIILGLNRFLHLIARPGAFSLVILPASAERKDLGTARNLAISEVLCIEYSYNLSCW